MQPAIQHLLLKCGNLRANEKLAILCDPTTRDIANSFFKTARNISDNVSLIEMPVFNRHGEEPTQEGLTAMLASDLIISLCKFSLAHSQARIEAGKKGARFLSMPLYSWELLNDPAVSCDYQAQSSNVRMIADAFTNGSNVKVSALGGTNICLDINGRKGNYCPGYVERAGELGSPPDIEANVSPIEDKSEGLAVIDGSITCPEIGLLYTSVSLEVRQGKIIRIYSENSKYVEILENMLGPLESKRRILAECGVGLNPKAKLTGTMLTDEGALGCIHFGFGSNYTVGGQNQVDFHLDFVFRGASLEIDGVTYLKNGELL